MTHSHTFCHIKRCIDYPAHFFQFFFSQIVLCYRHICFDNFSIRSVFPSGQSHVFLIRIGSFDYQLRNGMSMHSIVHFVLYLFEEKTSCQSIFVIVYSRSINIGQFLIKTTLTQPYLPYFGKQMFKVILTNKRTVLHSLLVNHITTDGKLTKHTCTPLTELSGTNRINSISNTDNGIKIIEHRLIILPVCGSCRVFLGN